MTVAAARPYRPRGRSPTGSLEARARTLLLVAPLTDEDLRDAARPADEPDPLGPRPHRALRGAVAHPEPRRARSSSSRCRGCTIRSSIRAATRGSLRSAVAGAVSRDHGRDPGPRPRRACRRRLRRPPTRCCATGTCTTWCFSTSTSTTRRFSRRCSSSTARRIAPLARIDAPGAAAGAGTVARRDGPVPRRARSRSAPTTASGPTTTSGRRTRSRSRRSGSTSSGHQRRLRRVHRGRRVRSAASYWSEAGWQWRTEAGRRRAEVLVLRRRRLVARVAWTGSAPVDPRSSGVPRLLLRGRGVRAMGRQAAADRDSSGRPPRRGIRRPAPCGSYPWGDEPAAGAWPTSISSPSAPRRSAAIRATCRRSAATA